MGAAAQKCLPAGPVCEALKIYFQKKSSVVFRLQKGSCTGFSLVVTGISALINIIPLLLFLFFINISPEYNKYVNCTYKIEKKIKLLFTSGARRFFSEGSSMKKYPK